MTIQKLANPEESMNSPVIGTLVALARSSSRCRRSVGGGGSHFAKSVRGIREHQVGIECKGKSAQVLNE